MEFLEDDPVADDVLDVVGQHRRGGAEEIHPEARMPKGSEGNGRSGKRAAGLSSGSQSNPWNGRPAGASRRTCRSKRLPRMAVTISGYSRLSSPARRAASWANADQSFSPPPVAISSMKWSRRTLANGMGTL